jgi:anti-sigma factor RsiW
MRCARVQTALQLYVDSELAPREELELEAHLLDCSACRQMYEELRAVVDTVRGARPLYDPSPRLQQKLESMVGRAGRRRSLRLRHLGIPTALAAGTLFLLAGLPSLFHGGSFRAFAADTHLRFASGRLPLDVTSSEPAEVSAWLERRMPFRLTVPDHPADSSEPKAWSLVGARLMQYRGDEIAYLAYTMKSRPVSLLVSSGSEIQPSGGEVLRSGNLLFHFSEEKGLKLITWRDRGLVYALVSDVQVNNAESCVVCHGSAAERPRFQNMSLARP